MTLKETTLPFLAQDCRQAFGPTEGGHPLPADRGPVPGPFGPGRRPGRPAIRDHLAGSSCRPGLLPNPSGPGDGPGRRPGPGPPGDPPGRPGKEGRNGLPGPAPLCLHLVPPRGQETHGQALPPEGWETQWVSCDGKEIHFNLHTCLYQTVTQALGARSCAPCTARMTTSPSPAWPLRSPSTEPAPWPAGPPAATFIFSRSEDSMQYLRTKKAVATANPTERK